MWGHSYHPLSACGLHGRSSNIHHGHHERNGGWLIPAFDALNITCYGITLRGIACGELADSLDDTDQGTCFIKCYIVFSSFVVFHRVQAQHTTAYSFLLLGVPLQEVLPVSDAKYDVCSVVLCCVELCCVLCWYMIEDSK